MAALRTESALEARLAAGQFAVTAEIGPPKSADFGTRIFSKNMCAWSDARWPSSFTSIARNSPDARASPSAALLPRSLMPK